MKNTIFKGLFKENPILVLAIGLCPALAVTTTLERAIAIGIALLVVLICSNLVISLIRKIIPEVIKKIVCLVVITTFTTMVSIYMNAYLNDIYTELGIYLSLLAVNYLIIERTMSFSLDNNIFKSFVDSLSFGIGSLVGLILIAATREMLGSGMLTIWGSIAIDLMPIYNFLNIKPSSFFVSNSGAFIVIAFYIGIIKSISYYRSMIKNRKVA